jgi:ABC-type glycerol-3-phosphate transport system substrate-binding protein
MSTVESKHGAEILKQTQAMAEMVKGMMPKVSTNQNGYEIRTKVLEMAQNQSWNDYHAKFAGWSTLVTKEGDEVVTTIEAPVVPGTEEVLEAANKFIEFVNGNKPSK